MDSNLGYHNFWEDPDPLGLDQCEHGTPLDEPCEQCERDQERREEDDTADLADLRQQRYAERQTS